MFSKLFSAALVLGLTLQVSAHAVINPALGVAGTARRADAKRPSTAAPCGNGVNVATALAASTPVAMNGNTFTTTVTNFNGGRDGSRQVTAQVDATGTGKNFVAATVTQNGDAAPTGTGSQQITVQMPAGTTCTGGSGSTCLVSFKTAGNFGNCIAVSQGGAAAAAGGAANAVTAAAATNGTAAAATGNAATGNTTTTATGKTTKAKGRKAKAAAAAAAAAGNANAGAAATQDAAAAGNTTTAATTTDATGNTTTTATTATTGKAKGRKAKAAAAAAGAVAQRDLDVRAVASRAARLYRELEALAARDAAIAPEDIFPDTDEDDFEEDDE